MLSPEECDAALLAIANFVDLKSPYTLGHSHAVAELAAAAGTQLGMPGDEVRTLYRAGLVHDFGRLGVSNSIWDKRGPLGAGEWERVRMHPYFAERMLQQSETLAPLARIAVQHRERLDGSGYPRGLAGSAISRAARVVGAADAYQAMREPRPYRPARTPDDAAAELRGRRARRPPRRRRRRRGADRGRPPGRPAPGRAGRIDRTRGRSVAARRARAVEQGHRGAPRHLPEDHGQPHRAHLHKIGASNRATASLFAMQHGLLPEEGFVPGP